jgi:hypothetical protein
LPAVLNVLEAQREQLRETRERIRGIQ